MDVLVSIISRTENFEKTGRRICQPLVIHCVPGAGKSSLIRNILASDTRFIAITFGAPDSINLTNRRILDPLELSDKSEGLLLIDEYTEGEYCKYKPLALFGDPLQCSGKYPPLEAHFINRTTCRFGRNTCDLLNKFNFDIRSNLEDEVFVGGLFEEELGPIVIAVEPEVKSLLKAHGVDYLCLEKIRGLEFDSVTFCTAENNITESDRAAFFVALTRHRKSLRILSPDATFTPC